MVFVGFRLSAAWTRALRERKPPPTPKFESKVIWDSNPDFRIIRVRIWMSVRSVLKCCGCIILSSFRQVAQVWYKSAVDCMRNAINVQKIPYSAMVKKMKKWSGIHIPHAYPDHHHKLITSRTSSLAHACQVWSTSVSAFVCYPVYRITEWPKESQIERSQ